MKIVIVVVIAALSAAIGETLLSYSMKLQGGMSFSQPSQWAALVISFFRNPYLIGGVIFLMVFFFLYLAALSWADLSFVLPLTAVSYIFAALLARFFLNESIPALRWAGTLIIVAGIALVALGGKARSSGDNIGYDSQNTETLKAGSIDVELKR